MPNTSLDPAHFYQTSTDIATRERRAAKLKSNRSGHPISLSSRVLALCRDARSGDVFAALSGGEARKLNIPDGTVDPPFRTPTSSGPVHPLTSLALVPKGASSGEDDAAVLLGGSWSAKIYAWNVNSRHLLFVHDGAHTDFVKTLLLFPLPLLGTGSSSTASESQRQRASRIILASAAADTRIALWDMEPSASPSAESNPASCLLGTLSGHTRPVLALAADPAPADPHDAVLFSGSSDGEVRRWRVRATDAAGVKTAEMPFDAPLRPHPSSIYALAFGPSGDELWTAGADGTARCLARPLDGETQTQTETDSNKVWTEDTVLKHGDTNAVRALALSPDGRFVVAGCRDEDIWVWDASAGEVLGKFTGHADEVVALLVDDGPMRNEKDGEKRKGWRVVSGGLDSTVRVWDIGELIEGQTKSREGDGDGEVEVENEEAEERGKKEGVQLTEEEERELAELMEDDDD